MTRTERRNDWKAAVKKVQYANSRFKDRARYAPFQPKQRTDRRGFDAFGNPRPSGPFPALELHERAVARRDFKRRVALLMAKRPAHEAGPVRIELHMPPHRQRGTAPRRSA